MILHDVSSVLGKLWMRPAQNADLIVILDSGIAKFAEVHSLDPEASRGFVVVQRFPSWTCVTVDSASPEVAEEILGSLDIQDDWGVFARSEEMAHEICQITGRRGIALSSIHYAVDRAVFRPVPYTLEMQKVGPDGVAELLEWLPDSRNQKDCVADAASEAASGSGVIFAARQSGALVGYIAATKHVKELWEVGYCYVEPEKRSRGVGRQLISAATEYMLDAGAVPLYTTAAANDASGRACLAVGYYRCPGVWRVDA